MGTRRERRRERLDREAVEEEERIGFGASENRPLKSEVSAPSDDDDEDREANEDLSLKIVEKALLMRAAGLVPNADSHRREILNLSENCVVSTQTRGVEDSEENGVDFRGKKVVKKVIKKVVKKVKLVVKKKKEIKKTEIDAFAMEEEEDKPENVEPVEAKVAERKVKPEVVEPVETEVAEPNPTEAGDNNNIVLRKLLRGPRYFDPPDSSWGVCYNCGEEGHNAVNCTSAKRRKPCFVCGSFEHNVKQCTKGRDCFICKKSGHRAKDCPDKYNSSSINSKICLKCGNSGHDMFFCQNDYNNDDLKELCCYICKKLGHLCCVNYVGSYTKEISCYRCGQLGHTGLSCSRSNGETAGTEPVNACFKCGEGGHFAWDCTNPAKVKKKGKRNREPSTPTLKPHREPKHSKIHKSAPHDLGKPHHKKKPQHEGSGFTTPRKLKQRGGWITEDPGDYSFERSNRSGWRTPSTSSSMGHRISYMTPHSHVPTSHYPNQAHYGYRTPDYQVPHNGFYFQNGHSESRFSNPRSSGGSGAGGSGWNRRNYDRW